MISTGIDHVGVSSSDLDRSLRFYCDLLGMRLVDRGVESSAGMAALLGIPEVEFEYADLDAGDGRTFELICHRSPVGEPAGTASPFDRGTPHIAVRVADLGAVDARLAAADVPRISTSPLAIDAPGSVWDRAYCLLVRDPDGVIIELVERRAE
jgi:glyoxylase I family protein